MKFSVKILESNSEIYSKILNAMLPEAVSYLKKALSSIKNNIPPIVSKAITNRPEYMSLTTGTLRLELGIPDANSKVLELIDFWTRNISIDFKSPVISGDKIKGSFSISLIKSDFSDILGSDAAFVYDSLRGYSLPWLEWLLLDGTKVLVRRQQVIISPNKRSRTGMALMRESGQNWSVPPQFAGTINDNWITRAIDDCADEINNLIEGSLS
jgi:hypothetical protein